MDGIGIGLIGVGGFGRTHLAAIRHAESQGLGRLVAAVILPGLEPETETELRSRGVLIYRSHTDMLARVRREAGGVELVGVPCGIGEHAPLSIAALEAGFHVLSEKPAAGNLADALEMQRVARRTGKILAIGYQDMYSPVTKRIKELTLEGRQGGKLGRLLEAKGAVVWPRPSSYYGRNAWAGRIRVAGRPIYDSPIQNATAHYLQALLYAAGARRDTTATPTWLYGENYRSKDIESADTQFVRVRTREGVLITFLATHSALESSGPLAEYRYERGSIRWSSEDGKAEAVVSYGDGGSEKLESGDTDTHHLPYLGVLRAIREGGPPAATIDNCIQHTAVVEALFTRCELLQVSPEHVRRRGDGEILTYIPGMEELAGRMYARAQSFHEAGAPWARPGKETEL